MTLQRFKYVFFLLFVLHLGNAQEWVDLMRNPNVDFREAQKAFEEEWADKEYKKGKGYKQFKRWENFILPRMDKNGRYDPTKAWSRFAKYRQNLGRTARVAGSWVPVGPFTPPGGYNASGIGRIDCIAFHPQDSSTYWVGAPSGGLWKTTNDGEFWTTSSDDWEGLGISDIVIDASNPNTMYVATGDRDHYAVHSYGVLKSIDGGNTWSPSGLNTLSRIYKLLIDPNNSDVVIAATCCGVYRTTDGGINWNIISSIPRHDIFDIAFKPGDSETIYAVSYEAIFDHEREQYDRTFGFHRSTDNGLTFNELSLPFASNVVNRAEIGVSAAAPDQVYLYCSDATNSSLYGLYRSTESGENFTQITGPNDPVIHPENNAVSLTIMEVMLYQGWYDWTMNVNPKDANEIYLGAVGLIRSYDGGSTWEYVAGYNSGSGDIHTDFHALEYHPITNRVFTGCDGGVWREPYAGLKWTPINDSLLTTQNYTLGSSLNGENLLIGNQDNATYYYDGQEWDIVTGGDGMGCIIDPADPEILYTSSQQGFLYKIDHGQFTNMLTPFVTDQYSRWETVIRMDPIFRNELYTLYEDVWKTVDAGDTWTNISNGKIPTPFDILEQLEIAESNAEYIYTADRYDAFRTTDGGDTWEALSRPWEMFEGIGDMEIDPTNPDRLWICTWAGRVFRTEDGGRTWVDMTGTLPDISANNIIYQKGGNEGLYLAMDVGIFYRDKTMSDWMPFYADLPNVVVTDLEIVYCSGTLRAATFGRGVWETQLQNFNSTDVCCNMEVATLTKTGETLICGEPSYMISASAAPSGSTYQWYRDGEAIQGAIQSSYEATESGVYTARFINGNCPSLSADPLLLTLLPNGICTETCTDLSEFTPNGPGNPTVINITESIFMPDPNEQVWICVSVEGDIGNENELFNIYDENNNLLGETIIGRDCSGPSPEICFYIDVTDFENWISDGQLTITLDPQGTDTGLFCQDANQACVALRYSTPSNINCEGDLAVPFTRNNTFYKAGNILTSTANIPYAQTATFTAGQHIDLQDGFDATFGSDLDAYIAECTNLLPPAITAPTTNAFLDNGCDISLDTKEWYFEWTEVANASSYHLLVYAPNELAPIINKKEITGTRFSFNDFGFVENNQTKQWKVLVRAQVDNQFTNWSSMIQFNVELLNADCQEATARSSQSDKQFSTLDKELQLMIHPNPATDQVNINYFLNKVVTFDIQLYDLAGQQIQEIKPLKSSSPGEHSIQLNTTHLPVGMYYIVLKNKDFTISEKLVVIE